MRHGGDERLEILHLLPELPPQDVEIRRQRQGHPLVLLLLRHDDQVPRVQLRQDVSLQRSVDAVYHVGGRVAHDHRDALHGRAEGDVPLLADVAPVLDDHLQRLHGLDGIFVQSALVVGWEVEEVYGIAFPRHDRVGRPAPVGRIGVGGLQLPQVLVEVLGDEGRERRHEHRHVQQDVVQYLQSRLRLALPSLQPLESIAVQPDVPVGQLGDEPYQRGHDRVQAVGGHLLVHELDESLGGGGDPHVGGVGGRPHLVDGGDELFVAVGLPPFHVLDEEPERVVEREEDLFHHAQDAALLELEALRSDDRRVDEVHPQCIGPVLGNDEVRVGVILEPLGHLLPVPGQDQSIHDEVLERRPVEQRRAEDHERVKPAPGLVESLGDEVGGEPLLELLLVLEGVMLLCVGHGARLEPAVEDLVDPSQHRPGILLGGDGDLVDDVLVQVGHAHAAQFCQLVHAPDADDLLHVLAAPYGDGRAPEPIAAHGPVPSVHEPAVEPSLLHGVGDPVRFLVVLDDFVADLLHLDEPRRHGLVDEGRVAAPAEGVAVVELVLRDQPAPLLDELDERVVALLDVQPLHFGNRVGEHAVGIDGAGQVLPLLDDAVGEADAVIVLTEGRGLVDDARAGVVGDVGVRQDAKVLVRPLRGGEVVEEGSVPFPHQVAALVGGLYGVELVGHLGLPLLLAHLGIQLCQPRLGEDIPPVRLLVQDLDVLHRGMDAQGDVAGERPRRRRPGHEAHPLVVLHGEAHHHGRVAHVLVIESRLEIAQRRPARRAEGHDLVSLVHQILLEEFLEHPPHALHERGVHRLVVVLEVHPPSQPGHGPLPLLGVPGDDAPARLIVLVHAHLQDLIAVCDVELLVYLVLHREAVAVPPGPAGDVVTCLARVAGDDVLDGPREDVAVVGEAGGEGRAVIEGVFLVAPLHAQRVLLLERLLHRPLGADLLLRLGEVERRGEVGHDESIAIARFVISRAAAKGRGGRSPALLASAPLGYWYRFCVGTTLACSLDLTVVDFVTLETLS
mmetsp:Transcript_39804/g.84839  ORF Transcript_39804/g.84839 Transcript_39804/m.84839 type:complete len:1014 (+) Transcript_39804:710-3751(+)